MKAMLKPWTVAALFLAIILAGCASNQNGASQNQTASAKGQPKPITVTVKDSAGHTVSVGLSNHVIPWQDGLTLMRAFALSGYQGYSNPSQLGIIRNKEMPMYMDFQKLNAGQDMLLEPGDEVEIRP